jgi:hypothetical protein
MEVLYRIVDFVNIKPVEHEVLPNKDATSDRYYKLKKGVNFGRFGLMTKMVIMTKDGEKTVKSIVFELSDKTVRLKGKVDIPIKIIKSVEYIY